MTERQRTAKRATAGHTDAQLGFAIGQERFKLGVALKALRHTRHLRPSGAVSTNLAVLVALLAFPLKFLPTIHKLIGAIQSRFPNSPLGLHGKDGATHLSIGGFMREWFIDKIGALDIA
ncbi:MAG: hypothetical protein CMN67_15975 [Sphingomonadaceae bacterium]|nr:hypothetical protein [Sphingomonadaceae bacterium]